MFQFLRWAGRAVREMRFEVKSLRADTVMCLNTADGLIRVGQRDKIGFGVDQGNYFQQTEHRVTSAVARSLSDLSARQESQEARAAIDSQVQFEAYNAERLVFCS